jgi:hypothetical protein
MKLSWIFGSSMEAHHLLYAYLSVWAIQSGFCAWVLWNWLRTPKSSVADAEPSTKREDY